MFLHIVIIILQKYIFIFFLSHSLFYSQMIKVNDEYFFFQNLSREYFCFWVKTKENSVYNYTKISNFFLFYLLSSIEQNSFTKLQNFYDFVYKIKKKKESFLVTIIKINFLIWEREREYQKEKKMKFNQLTKRRRRKPSNYY